MVMQRYCYYFRQVEAPCKQWRRPLFTWGTPDNRMMNAVDEYLTKPYAEYNKRSASPSRHTGAGTGHFGIGPRTLRMHKIHTEVSGHF